MFLPGLYFFGMAAVISWLLVPVTRWLSFRLGVLDHPIGKKQHDRPMPLLGGLAMALTLFAVVGGHLLLREALIGAPAWVERLPGGAAYLLEIDPSGLQRLGVILGGGALVVTIGLLDDSLFVDMKWRLLAETAVALAVVALGVRPELRGVPPVLTWAVTVLWIVGLTNAFNLLDGLDGLAAGVALIASLLMGSFCLLTEQVMVAFLLFILGGAALGFLRHNWAPARIYMGSSGSLFLGFMLATVPLTAAFMQEGSSLGAVAMPVLILSVPLYDTLSVMVIRLRHRRSPFVPDHNHLFHRLRRLGLSVKQVVVILYLLTFAVGASALLLLQARPWETALILVHVTAMYGVFVVIEMTGVRLRDREQVLDYRGELAFGLNGPREEQRQSPATIRMLTGEGAELELTGRALPQCAEALALGEELVLTIECDGEAERERLAVPVRIRSVWQAGAERGFAGVRFRFHDGGEERRARAWIAALLYPDRGTAPAEERAAKNGESLPRRRAAT